MGGYLAGDRVAPYALAERGRIVTIERLLMCAGTHNGSGLGGGHEHTRRRERAESTEGRRRGGDAARQQTARRPE